MRTVLIELSIGSALLKEPVVAATGQQNMLKTLSAFCYLAANF